MSRGLVLRVEAVHLADGIVVQGEFGAWRLRDALGRLGEGLVRAATAVDDDAGPRSGIGHSLLPGQREKGAENQNRRTDQPTLGHVAIPQLDRAHYSINCMPRLGQRLGTLL